jgi:hypothetical protein
MMKKATHLLRAQFASPRLVTRALLFTGGAVTGAVVSVTASYGLVSALYPRQAAPAALAAAQPHAPLPTRSEPEVILASAPTAQAINVTPLEDFPGLVIAAVAPSAPVIAPSIPAPAALPAPGGDLVIATKSVTDFELPQPEAAAPVAPAPLAAPAVARVETQMPARALTAPPLRPDTSAEASPASFAALAAGDTSARTGATLGFAVPTPSVEIETIAAVAVADPDMPRIRPAPRPDDLPVVLAVAQAAPALLANDIPAVRPQPRPEQVIRAAAAQTASPEAEQPAPRSRSGGLFAGNSTCGRSLARAMPRRSGSAADGQQFFASLGGLSGSERDARVINELARGNMPDFLRQLEPVTFRGQDARGAETEIVICVTPDYLALGSDRDYVRVPLGLPAAGRIAGQFDMTLPTPRMVDAIYAQADVKLSPAPMQAGPQMSSTPYLLRHNATIEDQLHGRGGLVAGQKKDVVMASRMASAPGRVAIYGWHRSASSPIQPVSTVHGASYADYSHGIRLVSRTAYLNGRAVDIDELLGSSRYAYLLNKEGPLPGPVIRIASR